MHENRQISKGGSPLSRFDLAKIYLLAGLTLSLAIALMVVPRSKSAVARALFNGSHVLLSIVLALAALWLLGKILPSLTRWRRYGAAFAVALAAGIGLEVLQWFGPGDPSFTDVLRDGSGAIAGLLAHALYLAARGRRWLHVLGFVLCFVAFALPGLKPTLDVLWRKFQIVRQLPDVSAFEGLGRYGVVRTLDGARLVVTETPSTWRQAERRQVGKVTFAGGHTYPRLLLDNPFADWNGYTSLSFAVYSQEKQPLVLHLRIDDLDATLAFSDRFNTELSVEPGHNTYRIPLRAVREAPATRELDLSALENVVLFLDHPRVERTLFFERFWLE